MPIDSVLRAINNLDLKQLSLENVEILLKMVPTEQECKAYKEYAADKKDVNLLTEEDKFVMNLTKIERISSKLSIMSYIGNFSDSMNLICPVSFHSQIKMAIKIYFKRSLFFSSNYSPSLMLVVP